MRCSKSWKCNQVWLFSDRVAVCNPGGRVLVANVSKQVRLWSVSSPSHLHRDHNEASSSILTRNTSKVSFRAKSRAMLFLIQACLHSAPTLSTFTTTQHLHTSLLPTRSPSQPIRISRLYLSRIPRIHQAFLQSICVFLGTSLFDPDLQAILARYSDIVFGHVLLGGTLQSQRIEVDLVANPAERCDCNKEED